MRRAFAQVDVFGAERGTGNPVAVVLEAEGLSDEAMQRFARWTDLSETTFVLPPETAGAHYRVRIFTPAGELPFAGHPTLGTCHAWLTATGERPEVVVQQCAAGPISVRAIDGRLAFAAPPALRSGAVEEGLVAHLAVTLELDPSTIVDAQWVDNGPGWVALLLPDARTVLAVDGTRADAPVGLVAPSDPGSPHAFEVRAFFPTNGIAVEDPVTGSLNASLAQWLIASGRATAPYTARQGTAIGRHGVVHVTERDGALWIGGTTQTLIEGHVDL